MNKRILRYLEFARKEALKSTSAIHRHGAVIVMGNYIVSRGFNQEKSHPLQKKYDQFRTARNYLNNSIHAEINALIKSGDEDLEGGEMFLYRITKGGNQGISKPCQACTEAMRDAGISRVYYTTANFIEILEF